MTDDPSTESADQHRPDIPLVLVAVYAPFAAIALVAYVFVLWANVHQPGRIAAFLKSLRTPAATTTAAAPVASTAASVPAPAPAVTTPDGPLTTTRGATIGGGLSVASGDVHVAEGNVSVQRGTLDAASGQLAVRGAKLHSFVIELANIDGVIHHARYVSFEGLGAGSGSGNSPGIPALSFGRTATPLVDESTGFRAGAGIAASESGAIVFDTAPQNPGDLQGMAHVVFNDTDTFLVAEIGLASTDVRGRKTLRPAIWLHDAKTAANYPITSIPRGKRVAIRVFAFLN